MTATAHPGIPVVGESIYLPHQRLDRYPNGREHLRECHCDVRVTAVEPKPSGLIYVWADCADPGPRVALPLVVRLTPAGYVFNARMGNTPVKRHVRLAQQPAVAA